MPIADIDDGNIVITTQYHERHLVQQVPGAKYDRASGRWRAPLSWPTCVILRGLFGEQLEAGPTLADWSWRTYRDRIEPALRLRNAMKLSPDDPVALVLDMIESRHTPATPGEGAHEAA